MGLAPGVIAGAGNSPHADLVAFFQGPSQHCPLHNIPWRQGGFFPRGGRCDHCRRPERHNLLACPAFLRKVLRHLLCLSQCSGGRPLLSEMCSGGTAFGVACSGGFLDPAFSLDPKLKRLRKLSALLVDESSTGLYLGFYKSSIWFVSGLKGPRRER